jgi:hypothetical protein
MAHGRVTGGLLPITASVAREDFTPAGFTLVDFTEAADFTEATDSVGPADFTAVLILERSAASIMEGWQEALLIADGPVSAEGFMAAEVSTAVVAAAVNCENSFE